MKLNKIIYGILCLTTLNACSDQMEYKEYSNYGADYVKRTFGDVGGLVANIYLGLDTDYGNYSGAILGSATDGRCMLIRVIKLQTSIMERGVRQMLKAVCGLPAINRLPIVIYTWMNLQG